MRRIYNILRFLFAACLLQGVSSCLGDDPSDCCYNVRLEYRYQRYGTSGDNELGYYVNGLREYVFNEHGILAAINEYKVPRGGEDFFSEQMLTPGRYTVITLGNKNGYEKISSEEIGVTTKQELLMWINNPKESGIQGFSDRLYYGYRSFEVAKYGVSRIAVDMTHSHCVLDVTVRWTDHTGHPAAGSNYTLRLQQVPALYHFMLEFMVLDGLKGGIFNPQDERFPFGDRRRINYIPLISEPDKVTHTITGTVSNRALYGQFITFRYRSDSHVLLDIFSGAQRVMKEIDLYRFFRETGINLDYSLCQEYSLLIEIDGDRVKISLIQVDDWIDGGML